MLEKINSVLNKEGKVKYWDFRKEHISTNEFSSWNNHIKDVASSIKQGISIRILYGNGIGFSFSNSVDDTIKITKEALEIAKKMNSITKTEVDLFRSTSIKDTKKTPCKIHPDDISIKEKKDLVLGLTKITNPKITSLQARLIEIKREKSLLNSLGSEINQTINYTHCTGQAIASDNQRIENFLKTMGKQGGFELTEGFGEMMTKIQENALALTKAKSIAGGVYPVVADGALTDVFIHEALGHASEADHILKKESCLDGLYGKKLAKDFINVYDDPTLENEWGSYFYDDEGIKTKPAHIIKDGVLNTFLHSLETAHRLNATPTGNGRAEDVSKIPLVRMSNTYIETGDYKFEELIEGIKKGVYLKGSRGGQVDTAKGEFQFSCQNGFLIENGRITEPLREVSIAGNTLEILKNIIKVSKEYETGFPGHCGKGGQSVPVKGNCPSVLISNAKVGGL